MDDKIDLNIWIKAFYDKNISNRINFNKFENKLIKFNNDSNSYRLFRFLDKYIIEIVVSLSLTYYFKKLGKKVFKYEINPIIYSPNSIRNHRLVKNYAIDQGLRSAFLGLFIFSIFYGFKNITDYNTNPELSHNCVIQENKNDEDINSSLDFEKLKLKYNNLKEIN